MNQPVIPMDAILFDDVAVIKQKLNAIGASPVNYTYNGMSFMGLAISARRLDLIVFAGEAGAPYLGEIYYSITQGDLPSIRLLYAIYGDCVFHHRHLDYINFSPLCWCIEARQPLAAKLLISLGCEITDVQFEVTGSETLQIRPAK